MNHILIVDDEPSLLTTLEVLLSREGFTVTAACGGGEGLDALCPDSARPIDLVITDIKMPEVNGLDVLRAAKKLDPCLPVVLITAHADQQMAIEACNEGAYYFLEKPFENRRLVGICREALDFGKADRKYSARKRELSSVGHPDEPIGEARCFRQAIGLAAKAAGTESTILIQGENGTGKELVARYIYRSSRRSNRPFVTVNCGALQDTLLESELFGHVKGSFTGAIVDKDGLFKVASGGTVFLDEVGDTSLPLQVKLLRVLQEKEITPVGGTTPLAVDVRIIAATNRKLEEEVSRGVFREDLFYRLKVIPIVVPPLRERPEDIHILIDYFLRRNGVEGGHGKFFTAPAIKSLESYNWPGNVRELENVIERLCVLGPQAGITEKDLPEEIIRPGVEPLASRKPKPTPTLEAVERAYIHWVMDQAGGNKSRAAEILGIDPSTLYRKLSR
ncbi:MAG: sigma-54 dependent transcriptional regulator [Gemmatimonadota bacterium]|nr:sigma-54 dependent transcriptional regulator [Gemmatimonadota bacterium]